MGFFGQKPEEKISGEKAELKRLTSQREDLEMAVNRLGETKEGLEGQLTDLKKQIAERTQRLEIVSDTMSTAALLQRDGIEVIYTEGRVVGSHLDQHYNGGSEGSLDNVILFGDGAAFARYVKAHDGKIVLHGELFYRATRNTQNGGWDYSSIRIDEGLAFVEIPHIQAYFIPHLRLDEVDEEE